MNGDEIGVKTFLAVIAIVSSAVGSIGGGVSAYKIGDAHYVSKQAFDERKATSDAQFAALNTMDAEIVRTLREIRTQSQLAPGIDAKLDQVIKRFDALESRLGNLERMAMERSGKPGP